jgi:hypothetical protein
MAAIRRGHSPVLAEMVVMYVGLFDTGKRIFLSAAQTSPHPRTGLRHTPGPAKPSRALQHPDKA